jgi:hypothetical protein
MAAPSAPFLNGTPYFPPVNPEFGSGSATVGLSGNVVNGVQISSAGISPGATGADNVMAAFTLPALSFDNVGRGIQITACGSFAANGNTKTIKLFAGATTATVGSTISGGTAIASSGAVTTNGGGWQIQASIYKYGAGGANTQLAIHQPSITGAAASTLLAPALLTMTESGALIFAVTGNAATTATDIVLNFFEIFAMN